MTADACCRRRRFAWLGLIPGTLLALFAPKCPLCLAAYLSLIGLGAGTAALLQPVLQPLGIALAALAVVTLIASHRKRAKRAASG